MIENDKQAFAGAVREVLKSYRQECGRFILEMWWAALKAHDLKVVLNAICEYCAHPDKCKFPPNAGDIVGMIEGTGADKEALAHVAWKRVMDNCCASETVVFDDPAIHYAINVAFVEGWRTVGLDVIGSFEEQEHKRSFIKAYASYKDGMNYPPTLKGYFEIDNNAKGYDYNQITYIGDKQKALTVLERGNEGGMMKLGTDIKGIGG